MSKEFIEQLIESEAKKLAEKMVGAKLKPGESLYRVGLSVFVRTVTFHYTGRISFLSDTEVVLSDAAWIASSGRFAEALATGVLSEVEPYPGECSINRGAIVDISPWLHELPRSAK